MCRQGMMDDNVHGLSDDAIINMEKIPQVQLMVPNVNDILS